MTKRAISIAVAGMKRRIAEEKVLDPRPEFLREVRDLARDLVAMTKRNFSIADNGPNSFRQTPLEHQKAIISYMQTIDIGLVSKKKVSSDRLTLQKRSKQMNAEHARTEIEKLDPDVDTKIHVDNAIHTELKEELDLLDHSAWASKINSISVNQLKSLLQREGLSTAGRKLSLFERAINRIGYEHVFALVKAQDPSPGEYSETTLPPCLRDLAERLRHTERNDMCINIVDRASAMLGLSSYVVFELHLHVYGGFVRDTIIRGISHNHEDIDVKLSRGKGQGYLRQKLMNWCKNNNCLYTRLQEKGERLIAAVSNTDKYTNM